MPLLTQPLYEHGDPDRPGPYPHGRGRRKPLVGQRRAMRVDLTDGVVKKDAIKTVFGRVVDLPQIARDMVGDVDPKLRLEATWLTKGPYSMWVDIRDQAGETFMQRYFNRDPDGSLSVQHEHMVVNEQWRGQGKAFLRSHMRAYEALDVTRVTMTANVEVGAYAWARYGFTLADGAGKETAGKLRRIVDVMVRDRATDPVYESVAQGKAHLYSILDRMERGDKYAIWDIADLRDGDTNIGKALLMDASWNAELRLDDARAMKRFRSYVGE